MFSEVKQFSDKVESLKGSSGSCIKSAMYHIEKAEVLSEIDPEMAIFRLITAEEEAATAIILMLKEHGYEGASKLNKNNHLHKQCMYPFVCAVADLLGRHLKEISGSPPDFVWDKVGKIDAIRLRLKINLAGKAVIAEMRPPLNFQLSTGEVLHNFKDELITFLKSKGFEDTVKHLKDNANIRNKLLYSDGEKIPNTLADTENGKFARFGSYLLTKANVLIFLYFLTAPYKKDGKAAFVEQLLSSYIELLQHTKGQRL